MEYNTYEQMTVSLLKNLAREGGKRDALGLINLSLLKKLREPTLPREPTRKEPREKARDLKIRRYSKLNKNELMEQLENPRPLEYTRVQLRQLARERVYGIL